MKTSIGIEEKNTDATARELLRILADEIVLYTKTKNAHWNVEGQDFFDKHKFFEMQVGMLDEIIDRVAERIRSIGHYAYASLKAVLANTHLLEESREDNDSPGFIKELLADHETIIIHCRENIHRFGNEYKDAGSADFITGLMEEHEKMAWFLRAHLN